MGDFGARIRYDLRKGRLKQPSGNRLRVRIGPETDGGRDGYLRGRSRCGKRDSGSDVLLRIELTLVDERCCVVVADDQVLDVDRDSTTSDFLKWQDCGLAAMDEECAQRKRAEDRTEVSSDCKC